MKLSFLQGRVVPELPLVMGILNLTPDSFYEGSRHGQTREVVETAGRMLDEGATLIDLGAVSTRPGALEITEEEELERLIPSVEAILSQYPGCLLSVDTYRSGVARAAVEHGVVMVNDVYGGRYDGTMIPTVAELEVPYVIMHMKGTPASMQENPVYSDVVAEVGYFLEKQADHCRSVGIRQVILDPGFGFGKTQEHNFRLLTSLHHFRVPGTVLLAGLSRKSMIWRSLGCTPGEALNGTTVLNTLALAGGADILRVHDVREAVEAVALYRLFREAGNIQT